MGDTKQWFNYLHKERGLSYDTIKQAKLRYQNGWLQFPVFSFVGDYLFSKYRITPWHPDQSIRYKYEKGGGVCLYNQQTIPDAETVYICEGEIDALTLQQIGFTAVSSTGGCMSFKEEWVPLFAGKRVVIVYDGDDAGIKGAAHTALFFEGGTITFCALPPRYGKDINEIYLSVGEDTLRDIVTSASNLLELHIPALKTKTAIKNFKSVCREQTLPYTEGHPIARFLRTIANELSPRLAVSKGTSYQAKDNSQLERAKAYPIDKLVSINRENRFLCPYHDDTSPSMYYYRKTNTAFCFVCNRKADAIDIYGSVHDIDGTQADGFKRILKELAP